MASIMSSIIRSRESIQVNTRYLLAITVLGAAGAFAQTQSAAEEKSAAAWTPARLPDGQPDVQGWWAAEVSGTYSLLNPRRGGARLQEQLLERQGKKVPTKQTRIIDPADGQVPYQPWARAKQKDIEANIDRPTAQKYIDPQARCLPNGPLRSPLWSPYEIMQHPGYVVISYETTHMYRIVPLDGRPHPSQNVKLWMGDSRGHWEGNTLVLDVLNNNSKSRFSTEGDFASDKVHIVERYTLIDAKTMDYQATIDDPSVYTRPWTIQARMIRTHAKEPDYEQWEDACHEGEKNADGLIQGADEGKK